jgi:tetratricopeptide (TPR) repeat protein
VAEFTELLRYHPQDLSALVQLGLAEKASGDLEAAQRWFERALALDLESPVVLFYIAEVLYNRGLNDEALAALQRVTARRPDNPDAHYLMGFVLGDMGRHDEAKEAAKRAIRLNPTLGRAQTNLSLDKYALAKPDAATPASGLRAMATMGVADGGTLAHFNLGLAFRQKGYYAEALREYQLALERGEERTLVQQAIAELQLLRKDVAAGVAAYDGLIAEQPESPKLWNERGVALHQGGRYEQAAESYRRAIQADSRYAIAHNNLGVALFHAGDTAGAAVSFRTALDLAPTFSHTRLNLALLLFKGKRLQQSVEAYRQVLLDEPEHAVAWNGIGLVLTELRRFAEARNAFARAVQSRPDCAEAHYNLSFALSNLGDFDAALRETKRALELDPYYVPQKFELAIDFQYEHPDLSIGPDLGGAADQHHPVVAEFAFDGNVLDSLFAELSPAAVPDAAAESAADPYGMARDYLSKGLYDRAASEIGRALMRGAHRATGMVLMGEVFARQGYYGEALERFRDARRVDGGARGADAGEVRALVALRRAAEACPLAETLLAASPDDVDVLLLVASARAGAGQAEGALGALEHACDVGPGRADVRKMIGDVTRDAGQLDRARSAYREALDIDPDRAVVRYELAMLLIRAGEQRLAESELRAALDQVPTYADAALALADLCRALGRTAEALGLLVELLERDASHAPALLALGELLFESGRRRDAAQAWARLLVVEPGHPGALYYQGALLAERNRYREAIDRWDQVIATDPDGPFAARARRDRRTAADLAQIFVRQPAGAARGRTSMPVTVSPAAAAGNGAGARPAGRTSGAPRVSKRVAAIAGGGR